MPERPRDIWHGRIKDVEREFVAARAATDALMASPDQGRRVLPSAARFRDVRTMSDNLEGTYLIRLFAEFESGLRSYWATLRETEPPTGQFITAVAARRGVTDDTLEEVLQVQEYRNRLIHERDERPEPVPLAVARARLGTYFARLPETW